MKSNFFPGRTRRVIYHHFIRLAAAGLTLSPSAASRAVGFRATSLSKCPFNDRGARRNHSPQPTGTVPQVRRGGGLKDLLGTSSPPGPAGVSASRFISNHPYLLLCVGFFLGSLAFVFVPLVDFFFFFFLVVGLSLRDAQRHSWRIPGCTRSRDPAEGRDCSRNFGNFPSPASFLGGSPGGCSCGILQRFPAPRPSQVRALKRARDGFSGITCSP